jgi:hypothetical protein
MAENASEVPGTGSPAPGEPEREVHRDRPGDQDREQEVLEEQEHVLFRGKGTARTLL